MNKEKTYELTILNQHPIIKNDDVIYNIINNPSIDKKVKDSAVAIRCFGSIKSRKGQVYDRGEYSGKEVVKVEVVQHINNAINDSGYVLGTWSKEEITLLIKRVRDDVINNFFFLSTQEVGLAFYWGVREEYGEVVGLSPRIFYKWLKSYCAKSKIEANKLLNKLENKPNYEISEKEKEKRKIEWLELICDNYDKFVETGEYKFYDLSNLFYDYLKRNNLIVFNKKERKDILDEARNIIKSEHNPQKAQSNYQLKHYLKIINSLNNNHPSINNRIQSKAKEIGLKKFLTRMAKKNKSLREIIPELSKNTKG